LDQAYWLLDSGSYRCKTWWRLLPPKRLGGLAKRLLTADPYVVEEPHILGKFPEGPPLDATRKPNAERAEGLAER